MEEDIFKEDWNTLGLDVNCVLSIWRSIELMYEGRAYHNLNHILRCRQELSGIAEKLDLKNTLMAIWFHDIILDPLGTENEEKSAAIARVCLMAGKSDQKLINDTAEFIIATKHDLEPERAEAKIVADVDMSILGAGEEEYEQYRKGIIKEYSRTNVSPRDFALGRAALLERILKGPIFYTMYFQEKYYNKAERNIKMELRGLYEKLYDDTENWDYEFLK